MGRVSRGLESEGVIASPRLPAPRTVRGCGRSNLQHWYWGLLRRSSPSTVPASAAGSAQGAELLAMTTAREGHPHCLTNKSHHHSQLCQAGPFHDMVDESGEGIELEDVRGVRDKSKQKARGNPGFSHVRVHGLGRDIDILPQKRYRLITGIEPAEIKSSGTALTFITLTAAATDRASF